MSQATRGTTRASRDRDREMVISYAQLRLALGLLGVSFPFILAFFAIVLPQVDGIQSSISAFHHTELRSVFAGVLFAIGLFLLSYRGYDRVDRVAGDCACVFALGVALFPTTPEPDPTALQEAVGVVHLVFAALMFGTLAFFSIRLFTKTDQSRIERPKQRRNAVYRVCGWAILGSMALIGLWMALLRDLLPAYEAHHPVFWLESIAIVAFGVSWLVKSEALPIFRDPPATGGERLE